MFRKVHGMACFEKSYYETDLHDYVRAHLTRNLCEMWLQHNLVVAAKCDGLIILTPQNSHSP